MPPIEHVLQAVEKHPVTVDLAGHVLTLITLVGGACWGIKKYFDDRKAARMQKAADSERDLQAIRREAYADYLKSLPKVLEGLSKVALNGAQPERSSDYYVALFRVHVTSGGLGLKAVLEYNKLLHLSVAALYASRSTLTTLDELALNTLMLGYRKEADGLFDSLLTEFRVSIEQLSLQQREMIKCIRKEIGTAEDEDAVLAAFKSDAEAAVKLLDNKLEDMRTNRKFELDKLKWVS